jgi:hypothetical protein
MLIIRAVAIGRGQDTRFDALNTNVDGVRPYIKGLVQWLSLAPGAKANPDTDTQVGQYTLGTHYEIDYRERDVHIIQDAFTGAENADILFCMSTYVGEAAVTWRKNHHPRLETPIVVITSNPSEFDGEIQVCGVSALRPQLASVGISKFKKAQPTLTKIVLLHRQSYGPSDQAKKSLGSKKPPVKLATVKDTDDPSVEVSKWRSLVPANEVHGLFVLPADRFFGWATEIQTAAEAAGAAKSAMKTFWSTTDWPKNSDGGYGFPQKVCGRYMAERVASIWENNLNQVPDPAFITVDPGEIDIKSAARRRRRSRKSAARGRNKSRKSAARGRKKSTGMVARKKSSTSRIE